jgi:hypothetical protein
MGTVQHTNGKESVLIFSVVFSYNFDLYCAPLNLSVKEHPCRKKKEQ